MKNLAILIGRDFTSRAKGTSFILTTILGVVVIIGLAFAPLAMEWIEQKFNRTEINLLLLDKTGSLTDSILAMAVNYQQEGQTIAIAPISSTTVNQAIQQLRESDKTGLLVVELDEYGKPIFSLHSKQVTDMVQNSTLQSIVNQIDTELNAASLGLSLGDISLLLQPANFRVMQLPTDDTSESTELSFEKHTQSMILAYFLLFMIYAALIMYGNMVATGVAEEKSSRIMEIMVSTVKPMELMIGKVIGIGSLGLVQFVVWISTGLIMTSIQNLGISLGSIPITTLLWFGVFFLLGFLFYATLYAAGGALVSRVDEVQQVVSVLMMGIVVGFLVSFISFSNPDGVFATTASLIPFFSPMVMFARVTLSNPPVTQIILSIVILLGSTLVGTWIAARIYRVGILMYGKRPNFKEVFKYIIRQS